MVVFSSVAATFFYYPTRWFMTTTSKRSSAYQRLIQKTSVRGVNATIFRGINTSTLYIRKRVATRGVINLVDYYRLQVAKIFRHVGITTPRGLCSGIMRYLYTYTSSGLLKYGIRATRLMGVANRHLARQRGTTNTNITSRNILIHYDRHITRGTHPSIVKGNIQQGTTFNRTSTLHHYLYFR